MREFVKITRKTTDERRAERDLIRRSAELEASNKEWESFSYFDLRGNSPVRKPVEFDKSIDAARQLGRYGLILNESTPVPRRA